VEPSSLFGWIYELEITPFRGGLPLVFTELRVEFEINKVIGADLDRANFKVWGMGPDTREAVDQPFNANLQRGSKLAFKVGYESSGLLALVYKGESIEVRSWLEGEDWVTYFDTATMYGALAVDTLTESFKPGTGVIDALNKVAGKNGLQPSFFGEVSAFVKKRFINGKSFTGNLKAFLKELMADVSGMFEITVTSEGEMQVTQFGMPNGDRPVALRSDTGLLGAPEPSRTGCNLKTLIDPRIRPGTPLVVVAKSLLHYGQNYTATKVTHRGDTHGAELLSEVEALFFPPRF